MLRIQEIARQVLAGSIRTTSNALEASYRARCYMNFVDANVDRKVGSKSADRKSNDQGETPGESSIDKSAMESAQRGEDRQLRNEQTNSSNTIFSK